jgi:hypothetical protein
MTEKAVREGLQRRRLLWAAMLASALIGLGACALVLSLGERTPRDLDVIAYGAVSLAVGAPFVSSLLRLRLAGDAPASVVEIEAARRRSDAAFLAGLAISDAAILICGLAWVLSHRNWPLYAAVLPVATMAAAFPRREE